MSNSDYNKIISTINSVSRDYTYSPDPNNLICIDTSNNRIGINTLDPSYSLHISGGTIYNTSLIVSEISSVSIGVVIADITNKLESIFGLLILEPYPVTDLALGTYNNSSGRGTIIWKNNQLTTGRHTITGYRIWIYFPNPYTLTTTSTSIELSIDYTGSTTITIAAYNSFGESTTEEIRVFRI